MQLRNCQNKVTQTFPATDKSTGRLKTFVRKELSASILTNCPFEP